jgi:hypothetical protein
MATPPAAINRSRIQSGIKSSNPQILKSANPSITNPEILKS